MAYRTADILKALEETHGMIYLAASALGCSPHTIYRHAAKNPKVQGVIDSYRGKLVDKAELKLEQAVMAGEPWAVTLTLKSLGKNRGYVERSEVDQRNAGDVTLHVVYDNKPDA